MHHLGYKERIDVAVAPYWNVNVIKTHSIFLATPVAVAPYWNVNPLKARLKNASK